MVDKRSQRIFIVCAILGVLIPGIALYFQLFPFNQKDPIQIKKPEKFTALNLTKHVKENGILQINLSSTSNDNDQIRYIITNDPQNGSLSFVKPDFYFYQPNKGFIGKDEFTYIAYVGNKSSTEGHAFISIEKLNTPPIALSINRTALKHTDTPIFLDGYDPDKDVKLRFNIVDSPAHGKLTPVSQYGEFIYTPFDGYEGKDSFTYFAQDESNAQSNTAIATIDVRGDIFSNYTHIKNILIGKWSYSISLPLGDTSIGTFDIYSNPSYDLGFTFSNFKGRLDGNVLYSNGLMDFMGPINNQQFRIPFKLYYINDNTILANTNDPFILGPSSGPKLPQVKFVKLE